MLGSISPTYLRTAFKHAIPKSAKRQLRHLCIFAHLESESIKAVGKHVG